MFRWVIKGQLARGRRPGFGGKRGRQIARSVVNAWIRDAKAQGIRSIICLLDERQLRLYEELRVGLVCHYRSTGFHVAHINARNGRKPPLSDRHLKDGVESVPTAGETSVGTLQCRNQPNRSRSASLNKGPQLASLTRLRHRADI